jgi:hypothetical protein
VAVEHPAVGSSVNDVFERVLDNGIVVDHGLDEDEGKVSGVRDDDGGAGSSGVPAIEQAPLEPRRVPPARPERTRPTRK